MRWALAEAWQPFRLGWLSSVHDLQWAAWPFHILCALLPVSCKHAKSQWNFVQAPALGAGRSLAAVRAGPAALHARP